MFRVEITDDDGADPYFLYLWSVSEDEFHELKQQQRLLVDFLTFPTNLIELLQCCLKDSKRALSVHDSDGDAAGGEAAIMNSDVDVVNPLSRSQGPVPLRYVLCLYVSVMLLYYFNALCRSVRSYLAVLNTCDVEGKSVFSIVETNPFKHLTHLSLQFFPGDDAAIKTYLAARLAQINANKRFLSSTLKQTSLDLKRTQESEAFLQKQLDTMTQQTESAISREKMKYADDLNAQVRNS